MSSSRGIPFPDPCTLWQWYREQGYLHGGKYNSLETFLREEWEADFLLAWDANDMLALLHTWQQGDISRIRDGGDYAACLKTIKVKGLIMPSRTDLYFAVRIFFDLASIFTGG